MTSGAARRGNAAPGSGSWRPGFSKDMALRAAAKPLKDIRTSEDIRGHQLFRDKLRAAAKPLGLPAEVREGPGRGAQRQNLMSSDVL